MKLAQFLALMSRMLGAEEKTIRMIVRYLREAGLFTTGARGVNAPDITALDAARVFIAYMASQSPSKAVKDVLFFGALKPDIRASHTDFTSELGLNPNQPFERLIADILENKIGYTKLSYMGSIRLSESGDAWLECEYISQEFHHREQWMKMCDAIANRDTDEGKQRRLQGKTALDEMEAIQRSSSTKVQRSAEYDIGDLLEIGHELLGWEVE
ncbi:hypothetical protein [Pseudophaeobacter leonis]|uniref:hypothetical protein n=1 Tax=Pseudophaeobacter leonis TaxID=1144477 RepID=UPI00111C3E14|nr:hypothetical protein [Pseudophaeobacter leonis]